MRTATLGTWLVRLGLGEWNLAFPSGMGAPAGITHTLSGLALGATGWLAHTWCGPGRGLPPTLPFWPLSSAGQDSSWVRPMPGAGRDREVPGQVTQPGREAGPHASLQPRVGLVQLPFLQGSRP